MKELIHLVLFLLVCSLASQVSGEYVCKAPGNSGCEDCRNLTLCQGTTTKPTRFTVSCSTGQFCGKLNETTAGCFKNTTTEAAPCKCTSYPSYKADPYNATLYIVCISSTKQQYAKCLDGKIFSATAKTCIVPPTEPPTTTVLPPSCGTRTGFFTDDPSCKTFYYCFGDNNSETSTCPNADDLFDERISACVPLSELQPKNFTCPTDKDGGFLDTNECNKFHICSGGTELGDPLCCNPGQSFDAATMSCIASNATCTLISDCLDPTAYTKTCTA